MKARKTFGMVLMTMGILLVGSALVLFFLNQRADARAGSAADQVLSQLKRQIEASNMDADSDTNTDSDEPEAVYESTEMTEVMIDGYAYIGYISIPALDLDLPVMSQWDYTRLNIAPCRYAGAIGTNDLVICAHNYTRHFGGIKRLSVGDEVAFTDMEGVTIRYEVVSVEILEPTAVEDMTDSDYDLTLFTCTYGGASRVTIRCDRIRAATKIQNRTRGDDR